MISFPRPTISLWAAGFNIAVAGAAIVLGTVNLTMLHSNYRRLLTIQEQAKEQAKNDDMIDRLDQANAYMCGMLAADKGPIRGDVAEAAEAACKAIAGRVSETVNDSGAALVVRP